MLRKKNAAQLMKYNKRKFNLGNRKAVKGKELGKNINKSTACIDELCFHIAKQHRGYRPASFLFPRLDGKIEFDTTPPCAKYRLCLCMGKEGIQMNITFPAGPDLANLSLAGRGVMA